MRFATSYHQRGMSGSSWFMVIILLFSALSLLMKLLPHYMEHNAVDGQIQALLENPGLAGMSNSAIHRQLDQQLTMNNIREFETRDKLEIEKGSGTVKMHLLYEVRQELFLNIDAVMTFEENYEKVL